MLTKRKVKDWVLILITLPFHCVVFSLTLLTFLTGLYFILQETGDTEVIFWDRNKRDMAQSQRLSC